MTVTLETKLPEKIGDYKVIRSLGSGVMGEVFLASDKEESRWAIKTYRPQIARKLDLANRFEKEIVHENVMPYRRIVFDSKWQYYFISDYLEVKPASFPLLASVPYEDLLGIFVKVTATLAALAEKGILHGNLKPSNIQIRRSKNLFHPLVSDFGIFYIYDKDYFQGDVLRRTFPYMAPELIEQFVTVEGTETVKFSPSHDIYSVGCILTEVLTGTAPFLPENGSATVQDYLTLKAKKKYRVIMKNDPTTKIDAKQLNEAIVRAISHDPAARFKTMKEFSEALQKAAGG